MFVPILINDIVSVLYLQCLTHSRSEFRMPPCRWVLSKDFLVFVNQWDHLTFISILFFCGSLSEFRYKAVASMVL